MLSSLRTIWLRITASRYTRALEDENARLRAENRALLNSILGIAGIPPLRVDAEIERQRGRDVRAGSRTGKGGTSYDAPYNCQCTHRPSMSVWPCSVWPRANPERANAADIL